MARPPHLPPDLLSGPFSIAEARAAGLTWSQLRGPAWRRVSPRMYVWSRLPHTPELELAAIARSFYPGSGFAGPTAGYLHGMPVEPCKPMHVHLPHACGITRYRGLIVWRGALDPEELEERDGFPVTCMPRTLRDMFLSRSEWESVELLDAALHRGLVSEAAISDWIRRHRGRRGVGKLRRAMALAEPKSESPMETRLRLTLESSGLGRPQAQVELHDRAGVFVGRADLFYPGARLVIEYDGGTHRDTMREDNRRQNRIVNAGYTILRYTADDLLRNPSALVAQVRAALRPAA